MGLDVSFKGPLRQDLMSDGSEFQVCGAGNNNNNNLNICIARLF